MTYNHSLYLFYISSISSSYLSIPQTDSPATPLRLTAPKVHSPTTKSRITTAPQPSPRLPSPILCFKDAARLQHLDGMPYPLRYLHAKASFAWTQLLA